MIGEATQLCYFLLRPAKQPTHREAGMPPSHSFQIFLQYIFHQSSSLGPVRLLFEKGEPGIPQFQRLRVIAVSSILKHPFVNSSQTFKNDVNDQG